MATLIVNDSGARVQYTATAAQTNFSYPFEIFEDSDLAVWLTPVGQTPDPVGDKLVLTTDYTVTNAGLTGGGDVVLNTPATAGDIITIIRDIPIERLFDYSVGGDFTGASINEQLDKLTMTQQQNESVNETRQLTYNDLDELESGDLALPKLATGQFWKKGGSGAITAVTDEENPDWSTLRTELADDQSGSDGARLVGYYKTLPSTGSITVRQELFNIQENIKDVVENEYNYRTTTGSGNAYIISGFGGGYVASYVQGMHVYMIPNHTNTAGATVNINGLGVVSLLRTDGTALQADDLESGHMYIFTYIGSAFRLTDSQKATDGNAGLIKIASRSEVQTATDLKNAVSAGRMTYHPGVAKAWGFVDQAAGTLLKGYNITSVVKAGTQYTIILSVTMDSSNYAITTGLTSGAWTGQDVQSIIDSATQLRIFSNGYDFSFSVFGDLAP